jgi:hypothetical protein
MMIRRAAIDVTPVNIDHRDSGERVDLAGSGRHGGRKDHRDNQSHQAGREIARHERKKNIVRIIEIFSDQPFARGVCIIELALRGLIPANGGLDGRLVAAALGVQVLLRRQLAIHSGDRSGHSSTLPAGTEQGAGQK